MKSKLYCGLLADRHRSMTTGGTVGGGVLDVWDSPQACRSFAPKWFNTGAAAARGGEALVSE
jgi:hypothetical protein